MLSSIVVADALTRSVLLHPVFYLKAAQMTVQRKLIRKRRLDEFEEGHNDPRSQQNPLLYER